MNLLEYSMELLNYLINVSDYVMNVQNHLTNLLNYLMRYMQSIAISLYLKISIIYADSFKHFPSPVPGAIYLAKRAAPTTAGGR